MGTNIDRIHDQLTEFLVDENPRDIVLNRFVKERTSAGGFRLVPSATLAPQKGRLVQGNRQLVDRTLPGGKVVSPDATIVFDKDADVQRHDKCVIDGDDYEVVFVKELPWSTQAEVTRHGG